MRKATRATIIFIVSFCCLLVSQAAFAENVFADKIETTGVLKCYNDSSAIMNEINFSAFDGYEDVVKNNGSRFVPLKTTKADGDYESCRSLIKSLLSSKSIKSSYSMSDINGRKELLRTLGYVANVPEQSKCIEFHVETNSYNSANPRTASQNAKLCSSDGTAKGIAVDVNKTGAIWNSDAIKFKVSNNKLIVTVSGKKTETGSTYTQTFSLDGTMESLGKDISAYISQNIGDCLNTAFCLNPESPYSVVSGDASANATYVLSGDRQQVGKAVAETLTGFSHNSFTGDEKASLYYDYLMGFYSLSSPACDYSESSMSNYESQGYRLGPFRGEDGEIKRCYTRATKNSDETVNALNGVIFDGTRKHWWDLLSEVDAISANIQPEKLPDEGGMIDQGGGGDDDDRCYNAGIDGISWIACPALTNLTYTANGFDGIIDGMLAIKPEYYNANSDAHTVWEVMRNIANVAMIVILLIIIVSQISGYGVDNYGIKKMLPKLIIVAIIMNFSFIICELVIDLSNIVGVGLRDLFGGIGQSIGNGVGKGIGEMVSVLLGIAGGAGAVAGSGIGAAIAAVGVVSGPMIILMIIMALLGVIASLLIFFASLGIRLMLVIICIGVAPVAMVCYILPNTKKGFDTWWKAFKSCLIIYPICGAMLGISELIKGIAWSSAGGDDPSGVALKLVALIAPYLPFFLLPSLLKGAIASVSNLSGVIDKVENRVRGAAGTASKAFKDTTSYGNAMEAVNLRRKEAVAARTIRRLEDAKIKSGGKLNPYQNRFLARAYATQKSLAADRISDQVALINEGTNNGENVDALYKMYDEYVANGDTEGAVAVAQIAGRRGDTAAGFMAEKFIKTEPTSTVAKKVAKEIATGANSKNYRASSPAKFEYASQINKMSKTEEPIKAKFDDWEKEMANMHDVIDHHITDTSQLMSMKDSEINRLYELMDKGAVSDEDVATLQKIARDAKTNHEQHGGPWDETKAVSIEKIINYRRVPASSSTRSGDGLSIMVPPRRGR